MTQIKNFVVVSAIWAIGMVALTATRALIETARTPVQTETHISSQRL